MKLALLLLPVFGWAQTRDAIEKQLRSIEQQRESLRRMGLLPRAPEPMCEAMPEEQVAPIIAEAARTQQLPPELIRAVITQESAFRPCAVSGKGAAGLMQIMPATAERWHVADPLDPKANIGAGSAFLRQLLEKYKGDLAPALAAYNAGPDAVDRAHGVPEVPETRSYVAGILGRLGITRVELSPRPPPQPAAGGESPSGGHAH